jgi:hypothetical protein
MRATISRWDYQRAPRAHWTPVVVARGSLAVKGLRLGLERLGMPDTLRGSPSKGTSIASGRSTDNPLELIA